MKTRFLIIIGIVVGLIVASYVVYNFIPSDKVLEDTEIPLTWVSLPVTSCGYPWVEPNDGKTKQYFDEYRQTAEDYDGSFWLDTDRAVQYVITRYYEDLGVYVHDVKTYHDRTMERTGEGCNTTSGGTWFLQISYSDLDYFLNDGFEPVEFTDVKSTESKILQCYALFNCDIANQNFKECIGSKKDGNTIDNICSNSDITINDGCVDVKFPDGTGMTSCD